MLLLKNWPNLVLFASCFEVFMFFDYFVVVVDVVFSVNHFVSDTHSSLAPVQMNGK